MNPFGKLLGDSLAETYRIARAGLRHYRGDEPSDYANRPQVATEFMSCARGNLWRVVVAA